jgi:hypothetical protein
VSSCPDAPSRARAVRGGHGPSGSADRGGLPPRRTAQLLLPVVRTWQRADCVGALQAPCVSQAARARSPTQPPPTPRRAARRPMATWAWTRAGTPTPTPTPPALPAHPRSAGIPATMRSRRAGAPAPRRAARRRTPRQAPPAAATGRRVGRPRASGRGASPALRRATGRPRGWRRCKRGRPASRRAARRPCDPQVLTRCMAFGSWEGLPGLEKVVQWCRKPAQAGAAGGLQCSAVARLFCRSGRPCVDASADGEWI